VPAPGATTPTALINSSCPDAKSTATDAIVEAGDTVTTIVRVKEPQSLSPPYCTTIVSAPTGSALSDNDAVPEFNVALPSGVPPPNGFETGREKVTWPPGGAKPEGGVPVTVAVKVTGCP
jgi:hypothetical protein